MRPISGNVAVNVARLLGMDERLVQLPDPPDICGYRFAPEKYRELESVVPIPSARKRDGWLAEGDWPAVKCWSNGGIIMRWNVLFVAAILLVAASQPSVAQFRRGYESDHLRRLAGIQSRSSGISSAFG